MSGTRITASDLMAAVGSRGVPAQEPVPGLPVKVLLASIVDMRSADVRAQLLGLMRSGGIVLARVDLPTVVRASLVGRGVPSSLLDESELSSAGGVATFHALLVEHAEYVRARAAAAAAAAPLHWRTWDGRRGCEAGDAGDAGDPETDDRAAVTCPECKVAIMLNELPELPRGGSS